MTTESAHVTPTAEAPVALHTVERALVGTRAPAAVRAERRAWLLLWLAFATFCALVFAATKFAVDWVSSAEVNQTASVVGTRGLVLLSVPGSSEKTVLARSDLGVGTVIWLDRNTSADLELFDDSRVKLLGGATLELTRMEVGRFRNQHAVSLTQSSGAVSYQTASPVDVQVLSSTVHLAAHGDYTIWIDGELARVMAYEGDAQVAANSTASVSVPAGARVDVDPRGQVSSQYGLSTQLLANSDFGQHDQGWQALDVHPLDVIGTRLWVAGPMDSMLGLRILRQSVKGEHGETGLVQPLDRDVTGFRHLWLEAWARVDYADLSGGGAFGSEYPMMFRVKYEGPTEGSFYPWSVGFYYANPENRPVPPLAALPWSQGEWKLYRVDLMDTDPSRVPNRLLEFAVMSQGHSYDARVAGISLIGE